MGGVDEADTRGFLRPYAEIFSIPRAWRFSVAGIIGRMPMSMYGLGTVLLISAGTGRYGLAGSVSASGAIGRASCRRSEEHTSELQAPDHHGCPLLVDKQRR